MRFVKGAEQSLWLCEQHTSKELMRQSPIKHICVAPFNSAPGEKPGSRLNQLSWFGLIHDNINRCITA